MISLADVLPPLLYAALVGAVLFGLVSIVDAPSVEAAILLLGLSGMLPIAISGVGGIEGGAPEPRLFTRMPLHTVLGLVAPSALYWRAGGTLVSLGFEVELGLLLLVAMLLFKLGQHIDQRLLSVFGYALPLQAVVSALDVSSAAIEYSLRTAAGTAGMALCSVGVLGYGAGAGGGAHAYAALVLCFGLLPWQALATAKLEEAPDVATLREVALRTGVITFQMILHLSPKLPCLPPPVDFGALQRRSMVIAVAFSLPFQTLSSLSVEEAGLLPIYSFVLRVGMAITGTVFYFLMDFGIWSASRGITH